MLTTLQAIYHRPLRQLTKIVPRVSVHCEVGPYIVKTATEREELREALRLRYQVFQHEYRGRDLEGTGLDIDEFDFQCDHLVIIEKKSRKIIGTFRLNCSRFSKTFNAAREFDLAALFHPTETVLELGRACIHKDYRRGMASSLVWRGVAEYLSQTQSTFVFGRTSFKSACPRQAALLVRHFESGGHMQELLLTPKSSFKIPQLDLWLHYFKGPLTPAETQEAEALIPFLSRGYFKCGAKVASKPAWDAEFKCIDFLTILHRDALNRSQWKLF